MTYQALKSIHMLGLIIFLGNIIITGYWKYQADKTNNPYIVAFAQRLITLTDWIFTLGGVLLVFIGAYGMAYVGSLNLLEDRWLIWGQSLFIASGLIWAVILIPIQIKQAKTAHGFAEGGEIPENYWKLNRQWMFWGIMATLLPLANIYFMVYKP